MYEIVKVFGFWTVLKDGEFVADFFTQQDAEDWVKWCQANGARNWRTAK